LWYFDIVHEILLKLIEPLYNVNVFEIIHMQVYINVSLLGNAVQFYTPFLIYIK